MTTRSMEIQSKDQQKRDAEAYIAEHLSECEYGLRDFVADALNPATPMSLHIEICEECGFLHIAGVDCDVCTTVRAASGHPLSFLRRSDNETGFHAALAEARCRRARTLYDQWMSGHLCADALFWASMTEPSTEPKWSDHKGDLHFAPAPGGSSGMLLAV